jgi:hypothetical protein
MPQRSYYLDSVVRKDVNQRPAAESSPAARNSADTRKHCAYNQTRERFIGADVDTTDFSIASLNARLPVFPPNSGAGLWLIQCRSISPISVRVPVDLVYLDRHCAILDIVESFPISTVSAASPPADSILVLPSGTIRSTETQPGDQLILCPADEMQQRLNDIQQPVPRSVDPAIDAGPEQTAAPIKDGPVRGGSGRLLQWEDRSRPKSPAEMIPAVDPAHEEISNDPAPSFTESQETVAAEPAQKSVKPARSWLQRLLSPDPPQPRKAQRESLPGLSAYFFTGGAPVAHGIRDISLSGMYVFTTERWYPGTVVRMTLTDRLEPTLERSITVNATVVRSGDDGVGLKFVLLNGDDGRRGQTGGVNKLQIDQFLQRLRTERA